MWLRMSAEQDRRNSVQRKKSTRGWLQVPILCLPISPPQPQSTLCPVLWTMGIICSVLLFMILLSFCGIKAYGHTHMPENGNKNYFH